MGNHVFICYARRDREFVVALSTRLKERGVPVWLDLWNIPPGADWDQNINDALNGCTHFLIVLSPASVESREVRGELRTALNENKHIVPVLYQPCPIPRQLQIIEYADFTAYGIDDPAAIDKVHRALGLTSIPEQALTLKPPRPPFWRRLLVPASAAILLILTTTLGFFWITAHQRTNDILIWKVGSPHDGGTPTTDIPSELVKAANDSGLKLQIRTFPAAGFADAFFKAVSNHVQPDILAINNYGIIEGITTPNGPVKGIASNTAVRDALITVAGSFDSLAGEEGGWQYLISTSRNYNKARELALKKATCAEDQGGIHIDEGVLRDIRTTSLGASLSTALGDGSNADGNRPRVSVLDVKICSAWGNKRLAFVGTIVLFEQTKGLGQRNELVVLTKSDSWQTQVVSGSVPIVTQLAEQLPKLQDADTAAAITPPVVMSPPDQSKLPRFPEPLLEWKTSGPGTAGYLIESQFQFSQSVWSGSAFSIVAPATGITLRIPAPFGVGMQPHRWRVWAISKDGHVSMSEWRTINFTN